MVILELTFWNIDFCLKNIYSLFDLSRFRVEQFWEVECLVAPKTKVAKKRFTSYKSIL